MSSDEIWYGGEINIRLTDVIAHKSDYDHVHTGYAASNHTHNEYADSSDIESLQNLLNNKADVNHIHSEYAPVSHSHADYSLTSHNHGDIYANANHTHTANTIGAVATSDVATVTEVETYLGLCI